MKVTVFSKPICQGCKATKRSLDKLGIEYDAEEMDEATIQRFTDLDLRSAPVVEVDFGFGAVWRWAGHSPSRIETLDHALSCDDPACARCDQVPLAA